MQNKMTLLRDLQEIDQEISAIEKTRQGYKDEMDGFSAEATRIQDMLSQLNAEIATLKEEEGEIMQDLKKQRDQVEKVESRLPEIQTQKEYVAVLKEIDLAKKANKDLEESLEGKQQEISVLDEDRKEKDTQLAAIAEKSEARGAELESLLSKSEETLKKRIQGRESVAADLPKSLLRRYQNLFKRRDGLALAPASNGACLGCNMQLPPQQFNKLLHAVDIETCPHCNRILFIDPEV